MKIFKSIIAWYKKLSPQTRSFIWVRAFYLGLGVVIAHLIFVDKQEKVVVQQERDSYRDSLVIQRYKTQELLNLLKNDEIQDEKDSTDLRNLTYEQLLSDIATLQVVAGANK